MSLSIEKINSKNPRRKFSPEQQKQVVEEILKAMQEDHTMTIAAEAMIWGVRPITIQRWMREHAGLSWGEACKRAGHRLKTTQYTVEERIEIAAKVAHELKVTPRRFSLEGTAERLGIHFRTLNKWLREYQGATWKQLRDAELERRQKQESQPYSTHCVRHTNWYGSLVVEDGRVRKS